MGLNFRRQMLEIVVHTKDSVERKNQDFRNTQGKTVIYSIQSSLGKPTDPH